MLIPIEKPMMKHALELKDEDTLFLPFWKPSQASPYVAYWNRKGMKLETTREDLHGIWGTGIRKKR